MNETGGGTGQRDMSAGRVGEREGVGVTSSDREVGGLGIDRGSDLQWRTCKGPESLYRTGFGQNRCKN